MEDRRITASDFTLKLSNVPRSYFIDPAKISDEKLKKMKT